MNQTFKPNIHGYKVLTPSGFKSFAGVDKMGVRPVIRIEFEKDAWLECTPDHKIYISETECKPVNKLNIGDKVVSSVGLLSIVNKIDLQREEEVYDLIEVEDGHRYYANGVLSSNCKFIVYEETLISSMFLAELAGIDPILRSGQVRWYKKINPYNTYIVSLDPSLGTGGDYSAIQILEVPTLDQVGEWHHNTTPVQTQVKIMRDICRYIDETCKNSGMSSSIYYSVENNTVGEAALVAINEIGEETIPGMFLSEPIKKGHVKRYRKGFNTTHNVKIATCAKLKQLIETKKLTVNSKSLISELKTFVAQGISFAAKSTSHDDLVMSMLLAIRMIMLLQDWDQTIYEKIRDTSGEIDDYDLPMPIFISGHD